MHGAPDRPPGVARCLNAFPCRRTVAALARWHAAKRPEGKHAGDNQRFLPNLENYPVENLLSEKGYFFDGVIIDNDINFNVELFV